MNKTGRGKDVEQNCRRAFWLYNEQKGILQDEIKKIKVWHRNSSNSGADF